MRGKSEHGVGRPVEINSKEPTTQKCIQKTSFVRFRLPLPFFAPFQFIIIIDPVHLTRDTVHEHKSENLRR